MPSAQIVDSGKAWKFFADYKKKDREKVLSTFHCLTGDLHETLFYKCQRLPTAGDNIMLLALFSE